MSAYATVLGRRETPQTEPIPGTAQVKNSAGGFSFAVDDWARLRRFLILGTEGGSYYASEQALTKDNAEVVIRCLKADGVRTVHEIVEISEAGRAPKNDPAIFALAVACTDYAAPEVRKLALASLPRVCRIGTHLFHFAAYVDGMRGWGRGLRKAVADWYLTPEVEKIAYQMAKYQSRDKWSNRDLLRLSHPKTAHPDRNWLFKWAVDGIDGTEGDVPVSLRLIDGMERIKSLTDPKDAAKFILEYRLPRECVPTAMLNSPEVWSALLEEPMPLTAMIRNLGTMSKVGLLKPMSAASRLVCEALSDTDRIVKARVHPVQILMAQRTYASGHGMKSSATWNSVPQVVDALNDAFYRAFQAIEPSGKRFVLGIDVSGSMGSPCAGTQMTCCEGSTAMAMVTARTERDYAICGFNHEFTRLPITASSRMDDALRHTRNQNFGRTDCSVPMAWALKEKIEVDAFVIYTDSETWCGSIHPVQALKKYRDATGIPARLIVVGMVSNGFSIADPNDAGMLDVVGFDTATPAVIADFSAGR